MIETEDLGRLESVVEKLLTDFNNLKKENSELEELLEEYGRVCVMCFEHDHTTCHRSHLAESMGDRFPVEHIKTFIR